MSKKSAPPAAEAGSEAKSGKKKRVARSRSGAFPSAEVENLMRESGAFRVSGDAIKALNNILGERGLEIARYAVEIARYSGRRTIKETDISLAASRNI